jgi:DNA-binding IclR family transcriptional regulator
VLDTLQQGISAVAAPIYDAHGHVSAVLTALGASSGFDARPDGPVSRAIMREARSISQSLGWAGAA